MAMRQAFSGEALFSVLPEAHSLETISSTFSHFASTSFTRCSCSVRSTETIPYDDGFPSPFFSYSAINSSFCSFLSPLPALLYNRELAAASSSFSDTGPISTMCVLSVSQRWSSPFSFLPSFSEYTGRVTSITFLLSSPIVAVMSPLLTPFAPSPFCLLPHTRESVPSASVHDSPLSPDSYTLRRPSSHAVIMMSLSFSHSTTEGSLQPSSDIPFDSVQLSAVSFKVYMMSETAFSSFSVSVSFCFFTFLVASTGNTSVSSFILTPDPPPPTNCIKESCSWLRSVHGRG
ncbi:hypothetical protein TCDM_11821 [Trypanosoma cruzi Dm28c]|uniref:Uncharacterized protein n=1 Tax=Trypanosoma cruzi Dm28c TaxID=1416333 RepID=V5B8H0_TRYCR|nr:hypothetical protein TCDM_11821 [Trypanosoma cruzi Dm28c]